MLQVWLGPRMLIPPGHSYSEREGQAGWQGGQQPRRHDDWQGLGCSSVKPLQGQATGLYQGGEHAEKGQGFCSGPELMCRLVSRSILWPPCSWGHKHLRSLMQFLTHTLLPLSIVRWLRSPPNVSSVHDVVRQCMDKAWSRVHLTQQLHVPTPLSTLLGLRHWLGKCVVRTYHLSVVRSYRQSMQSRTTRTMSQQSFNSPAANGSGWICKQSRVFSGRNCCCTRTVQL